MDYHSVRGVHASFFGGARPARPLGRGMHASKRRAYARQACTPPRRGVHSLHARPKGRAQRAHPFGRACKLCTPLRGGVHEWRAYAHLFEACIPRPRGRAGRAPPKKEACPPRTPKKKGACRGACARPPVLRLSSPHIKI